MTLADYERRVRRLVRRSRPFAEIEDAIEAAPLDDDQKAALWLLAWSHQEVGVQRRMAQATLAAVSRFPIAQGSAGGRNG